MRAGTGGFLAWGFRRLRPSLFLALYWGAPYLGVRLHVRLRACRGYWLVVHFWPGAWCCTSWWAHARVLCACRCSLFVRCVCRSFISVYSPFILISSLLVTFCCQFTDTNELTDYTLSKFCWIRLKMKSLLRLHLTCCIRSFVRCNV